MLAKRENPMSLLQLPYSRRSGWSWRNPTTHILSYHSQYKATVSELERRMLWRWRTRREETALLGPVFLLPKFSVTKSGFAPGGRAASK